MLFITFLAGGSSMINQLLNTYLFKEMEYMALQEIAKFSTRLQLNDGEVLIHENEAENFDVFVLCSGLVEVISSSGAAVSGDVAISKQDLEVFGEKIGTTSERKARL